MQSVAFYKKNSILRLVSRYGLMKSGCLKSSPHYEITTVNAAPSHKN